MHIEILTTQTALPIYIVEIVQGDRRLALRDYPGDQMGRRAAAAFAEELTTIARAEYWSFIETK